MLLGFDFIEKQKNNAYCSFLKEDFKVRIENQSTASHKMVELKARVDQLDELRKKLADLEVNLLGLFIKRTLILKFLKADLSFGNLRELQTLS